MKFLLVLFIALWSSLVLALGTAGIPNRYMNDPAVDLTKNGKQLLPDEVHKLMTSSKGRFDISTLDPIESSDLWKNQILKDLPSDLNPILDLDEVKYHSPVLSPSGIFRFNIQNHKGDGKLYTMMLSKTVHSVLLAKNLLRKLGYQIPDIKYLPRIVLKFKDESEKKGFISYLENVAFAGAAQYWIVDDSVEDELVLQDLIVMESNHTIYNLAVGVTPEMIQGRRLMSSLAVPLTIVNLTESVNMFRWNAGVVENNKVVLFHDRLYDFQCSWEDARWITRRIEKLTRSDWEEIVAGTYMPKSVQMILVEKLISRRNSVMKLFKIDAKEIKVNSDISNGVELIDGKLTQEFWPGYASRFAYGDPESPLSASEIWSWAKSRGLSTLIDVVVGQVNQLPFMGTDVSSVNSEKFQQYLEKSVKKSVDSQEPSEIAVKGWIFPTFRGKLILSRNLVTGTYLGTDNLVQLVDTVGVAVGAGAFVGTMGLPSPLAVYANGEAMLMRTYAHLRPVTSIQKSLKYPFKNIFVPLVKYDYGKKLHEATTLALDPDATDEEKEAKIEEVLRPLKESMEVGESLLVTDSLGTFVGGQVSAGYKYLFKAALNLVPGHIAVSRFHVHRRSEHEFQIYKDLGHAGSLTLSFEVDSLIPILKLSYKKTAGNARVKFYNLNLNPKNPKVLKNASLLRQAIVSSSTSEMEMEEDGKPFVVTHKFKESNPKMEFLFWQWQKIKSSTDMTITNPSGDQRYFRRHYYGTSKGKNYQSYANALISHWVSLLLDRDAGLTDSTGSNPGYSFKGQAETRYLTFDQEVDKAGNMIEPFIRLSRIKNGWEINRDKAQRILEEMKQRYRHEFYNAPVLNDTRRIFLYNISMNILFYQQGIEHLLSLSEDEIKAIFRKNKAYSNLVINPAKVEDGDTGVYDFLEYLEEYREELAKGDTDDANEELLKAFGHAEECLTLKGMADLMGGEDNIYASSRIDGFREGDEDGDKPLVSSSLGEFGSSMTLGPLVQVQKQTDMLEGEFFIYWMMTRLI